MAQWRWDPIKMRLWQYANYFQKIILHEFVLFYTLFYYNYVICLFLIDYVSFYLLIN